MPSTTPLVRFTTSMEKSTLYKNIRNIQQNTTPLVRFTTHISMDKSTIYVVYNNVKQYTTPLVRFIFQWTNQLHTTKTAVPRLVLYICGSLLTQRFTLIFQMLAKMLVNI